MRLINNYIPPGTGKLMLLKEQLNYSGKQMAELAGVANSSQWRKYTGGEEPRIMNPHMLFFIAAQLSLSQDEICKVLQKMHDIGADFDDP
ncbi:TPA: XRE family transcriptional regulator [Salmonella enterica subsp. enterica serovar Muenchen]|nr:XRE family transcriptional regulator [Salmonella enterica]